MATKRLLALDVFRGATMMLMVLVNTPGSWGHIYAPFRHAPWHGLTLTDLVFPFFLFIVGVSMWFSMKKPTTMRRVLWRAFKIFLLGTFLRAMPFVGIEWDSFRIMGVLQRIAIAYALAAFMVLKLTQKQLFIGSFLILIGYWFILLGFGGEKPFELATNVVRKIDIAFLGKNHIWHGHKIAFDPEGLLSTLPAVVTVIFGYLTARTIQIETPLYLAIKKLLVLGGIAIILGAIWGLVFPINKALWTSSYVLVTAGIAAIVLAILLWILDEKGWRNWTFPFVVFGKNAILGFVLSNVLTKTLLRIKWTQPNGKVTSLYGGLYKDVFSPTFGALNGSLVFALCAVAIVGLVLWIFNRKGWFLKI